ncbi:MAG: DUF6498-containing protein [Candidatus Diapherotrites archaeon]
MFSDLKSSSTAVSLLFANFVSIIFAFFFNWSFVEVVFVYVIQSFIIGFFHFLKLLFTFKSVKLENGSVVSGLIPSLFGVESGFKLFGFFLAFFFFVHYSFFHLVYFVFLFVFANFQNINIFSVSIIISVFVFFVNHFLSFLYYYKKSVNYYSTLGNAQLLFFKPYSRIFPVHLTLIFAGFLFFFGFFNYVLLLFFMLLKTFVDLKMHFEEHKNDF